MNNNLNIKIKISNNAYDFLRNLLKFHSEYDCIALQDNISTKCCKSPKVEVSLDNISNYPLSTSIEDIVFCYDFNLCNNVKEIILVLKESNIHVKVNTINDSFKKHNSIGYKKTK